MDKPSPPFGADDLPALLEQFARGRAAYAAALAQFDERAAKALALAQFLYDAPEASLMTDGAGAILDFNAAALQALGARPGFLKGKALAGFILAQDRREFRSRLAGLSPGAPTAQWNSVLRSQRSAVSVNARRLPGASIAWVLNAR